MDGFDALWAFLVAAGVAFVVTPPTARLARRLGVLNWPRDRDLHDHDVPGLGGLAILAAVWWRRCSSCPATAHPRDPAAARWPSRWSARWTTGARAGCRRW